MRPGALRLTLTTATTDNGIVIGRKAVLTDVSKVMAPITREK